MNYLQGIFPNATPMYIIRGQTTTGDYGGEEYTYEYKYYAYNPTTGIYYDGPGDKVQWVTDLVWG